MSVARTHHNKDYTCMSNYVFKDKTLSLKAKGLLCLMLSLPDEWDYSVKGLASLNNDGETSVRTAIKELENRNYVKRCPIRENGKIIDWEYDIYEKPQMDEDFLDVENPQLENPQLENLVLENKDNKVLTDKINNNKIKKDKINNNIHTCNFEFGSKKPNKESNKVLAEQFLELYTEHCPSLGKIKKLNDTRIRLIVKLFKEYSKEEIITVLDKVENSDFLKGKTGTWKATVDWIIKDSNFIKIYEGNYDNNSHNKKPVPLESNKFVGKCYNRNLSKEQTEISNRQY